MCYVTGIGKPHFLNLDHLNTMTGMELRAQAGGTTWKGRKTTPSGQIRNGSRCPSNVRLTDRAILESAIRSTFASDFTE